MARTIDQLFARLKQMAQITQAALLPLLLLTLAPAASAEELLEQPLPFSVWLDPSAVQEADDGWPIWLESLETHHHLAEDQQSLETTYRIRFRRFEDLNPVMLLRLHFMDETGARLDVSAWSETGRSFFNGSLMASGLEMPATETLVIPMGGVDYIDIHAVGSEDLVTGIFLCSMTPKMRLDPVDFTPPSRTTDPFNPLAPEVLPLFDSSLLGRVAAPVLAETVVLDSENGRTMRLEVELEAAPLLALLELEILGADVVNPPRVLVNGRPLGELSLHLPDLADPAFRGVARPLARDVEVRYDGWLRAQTAIPGSALQPGLNRIEVSSAAGRGRVGLRSGLLQLKYKSSTFRYDLAP